MAKLPRDISGAAFVAALRRNGYVVARQRGSHATCVREEPKHSITVPMHDALRIGTLNALLRQLAEAWGTSRDEVVELLFGA